MFGFVNKLKSLLGIQKDVVEDVVEELTDKGIEAEVKGRLPTLIDVPELEAFVKK